MYVMNLVCPNCLGVSIKTLAVPIFGAKEYIRMQDFVFKTLKNILGHPAAAGKTFSQTHPPTHAHPPNAGAP